MELVILGNGIRVLFFYVTGGLNMHDCETAFQILCEREEELINLTKNVQMNEAETRFHIIDEIFTKVLGWDRKSIEVEFSIGNSAEDESHRKLYADYKLDSDLNNFLIEAKRTGRFFSIPPTSHRKYASDGVLRTHSNNDKFIDQCENYIRRIGVPFCVLTNGLQFMIIRNKITQNTKTILVFRDFADIKNNFIDFWSILSPFVNGTNALDTLLNTPDEVRPRPQYAKNIRTQFLRSDEQVPTGNIRTVTESYLRKFFSELTLDTQKQLLKDCYCDPSGRFTRFADSLKNEILPKELSYIKRATIKNIYNKDDDGNFRKQYSDNIDDELGTVFVLVGGVGAGKSTFVKYFYEYELDQAIKQKIIWINIDLLHFSKPVSVLNDHLTDVIIDVLRTNYPQLNLDEWEVLKEIYNTIVVETLKGMPPFMKSNSERVDEEIYNRIQQEKANKEDYLVRVFNYLKKQNMRPCLVFDNVDQKPTTWQEEVLLLAFNKAAAFNAVVISSLRLENYFLLRDKPAFDAIEPNVFRIEPPTVKELLKKRIHALKMYPKSNFLVEVPPGLKINVPMDKFISVLDNTLDSAIQGKQVEYLLEHLASGNMRRALGLFKTFIQSGNTHLYELLQQYKNIDNVSVDYNYVFDSLVLKDNLHYNSNDSEIFNLFDYYNDGFYSHMTLIYILRYLETKSFSERNTYVSLEELLDKFKDFIIDKRKLLEILNPLLSSYLINSNYGERSRLTLTTSVAISPLGKYYINQLITDWRYLYYLCVDTPISDPSILRRMKRIYDSILRAKNPTAKNNLKRMLIDLFFEYIIECESRDLEFINSISTKRIDGCAEVLRNHYNHAIEAFMNGTSH